MVRLNAMGQGSIEVGDARIEPEQPYLFAIALYLILERGKKVSRQSVTELIWPGVTNERHARQRFRQALLRLREIGIPIVGHNGTLLLERSAAEADFEAIVSSGTRLQPDQSLEFLPSYSPKISEPFRDWLDSQRSRVHAAVQRLFLTQMQEAKRRGDWAAVDAVATECLRLDPYNEEAVMAHAECAVMRGSKREALTILDSYMEGLGSAVGTIGLPAKLLRTRIAERLTDQRYAVLSERHFVGREKSMEFLQALLHDASRGAGSAAFIWGEPGIGKSRLVQELTEVGAMSGAQVVSTKCHPTDAGRPLSAFADLIPVLKTLPGALGCSAQTLSLLQRLTDRNRSDTFAMQEAGDAAFLAATIRRAVFDLVDAVADEGTLIMVIEDVHWLDTTSWGILSAMVEWSTTRTMLILMTSRTPHATESKVADPDRGFHKHHLVPLAAAESALLLDKLANDDGSTLPGGMREWSVTAAEGNPYYLRELVRHWIESQQTFGVPPSLAELIEARLNRLTSLALRVLQLCAAFGKHSTFERLEKATGYANHTLLDAIEELSAAVMLAEDSGVAVKHDLLATAALGRLGGAAVRLVHRQVAAVLEEEIKEQHTAALMWDCAEHWQRAGDTEHALATVRMCAKHLHSVGQVQLSIDLCEKALRICVTQEERLKTSLGLAAGLKAAGKWVRLEEVVKELRGITELTAEHVFYVDALHLFDIETSWRLRRRANALEKLRIFALDPEKDPGHRLQAVHLGLLVCCYEARAEEAGQFIRLVDQLSGLANRPEMVAHIKMIFHSDFGDADAALEHAHTLLALRADEGEPGWKSRARSNVAVYYRRVGLIDEAKALYRENFAVAADHHLNHDTARAAAMLALLALQEENVSSAEHWYARAMEHSHGHDEKTLADSLASINARIGLLRGDLGRAREYLNAIAEPYDDCSFRYRQTVGSIRLQVELGESGEVDRTALKKMAADFQEHCYLGQCDFFAISLYKALVASGDARGAAVILQRYVSSQRRDRGPMPPSLEREVQLLQERYTANDTGLVGAAEAEDGTSRGGALTNS